MKGQPANSYKLVANGNVDEDKVNRALIYFSGYLFERIRHFEVVILEAPEGKWWFTSDNPVTFNDNPEEGKLGICGPNSEFYLPLSKKYLAYFLDQVAGAGNPYVYKHPYQPIV